MKPVRTKVTVYLQGTMREYETDCSLRHTTQMFEACENLVIPTDKEYIYINKKECPIIEFREVEE